jgi:endonuclease YncB( thermonuclease family)
MRLGLRVAASAALALLFACSALAQSPTPAPAQPEQPRTTQRAERKPQPRPFGKRIAVEPSKMLVDDGDTAVIQWTATDAETVRFLGIDTPETRHPMHDLPYAQPFGAEARGFAIGAFAVASKIELLRSPGLDPYGRTLGYFFLDDKNYSVLVVSARLAEETITRYGDNGLPDEAAAVAAAAKAAGPVPFESPGEYRKRMREVSRWMKSKGINPED